jgi:amino acid transporter
MLTWSSYLRHMNHYTQTPLYSVWAVVLFCCLLNLIALGSTQTINGIFGVTAPAMDLSYIAVIAARMCYEKEHPVKKGPFSLGRWQKPINLVAIIWVLFISVILSGWHGIDVKLFTTLGVLEQGSIPTRSSRVSSPQGSASSMVNLPQLIK